VVSNLQVLRILDMTFLRLWTIVLLTFSTLAVSAPTLSGVQLQDSDDVHILYVTHQTRGILTLQFDPSQPAPSSLTLLATNTQGGHLPSWLTLKGDVLYSVSRDEFPVENSTTGGAFLFGKQEGNREVALLSSVNSDGAGGVHCDVSRDGRTLSLTNMFVFLL
jgi:hypothetical protein